MKVLVTGANGYIAKSVLGKLPKDYSVTAITRSDVDLIDSNRLRDWFTGKDFDVVIHTAIVGGSRLTTDTSSVLEQNMRIHYNLLANSSRFGRLITFGSGAEIFAPESPYGLSKRIIANSLNHMSNAYNIRIFGVFDANELPSRFIKSNIIRCLRGEPMEVHENKMMDFFYMPDLIRLVQHYIVAPSPPKAINCSYRQKATLLDLANKINAVSENPVPIRLGYPQSDSIKFYCGTPCELAIEMQGLDHGIKQTYGILREGLELSSEYGMIVHQTEQPNDR